MSPSSRAISCRTISRRRHSVESFGNAADCIGKIESGDAIFAVTRGQFSMLDAINAVIVQLEKPSISLWTWTIADYEVECMNSFLQNGSILSGILVIDRSAEMRSAETIEEWRRRFGESNVRVCKNHAKIARVWDSRFHVLLRGSMNLNFNPRFEQLDITEGGDDFSLVEKMENELPVLPRKCDNLEATNASKLGLAFEKSTLKMFEGLKTWAK